MLSSTLLMRPGLFWPKEEVSACGWKQVKSCGWAWEVGSRGCVLGSGLSARPFPMFDVSQFSSSLLAVSPVLGTCVGASDKKKREMGLALKNERQKVTFMRLSAQEDFTILFSVSELGWQLGAQWEKGSICGPVINASHPTGVSPLKEVLTTLVATVVGGQRPLRHHSRWWVGSLALGWKGNMTH